MSKPADSHGVKSLLAKFEETICENRKANVSSGMYLSTMLSKNAGPPGKLSKVTSTRKAHISKPKSIKLASEAVSVTSRTATETDHDSFSHQKSARIDTNHPKNGSRVTFPDRSITAKNGKGQARSESRSSVSQRFSRRPSITAAGRRTSYADICNVNIPERIDEESDCVDYTMACMRSVAFDFADDDTVSVLSSKSFASGSKQGSVVSKTSATREGEDDDKSVCSAISRSSPRLLGLPRDVEFDSDYSSSSESDCDEYVTEHKVARTSPRFW